MNAPRSTKLTAIDGGRPPDQPRAAVEFDLAGLIPEKDVPVKYPGIFAVDELPELRRRKKISCFRLSAQRIFYRDSDLKAYIARFFQSAEMPADNGETLCHDETTPCLSTENSGSIPSPDAPASIATGAKAEESAAASLMLEASTPPKPSSSRSPSDGPSPRGPRRR